MITQTIKSASLQDVKAQTTVTCDGTIRAIPGRSLKGLHALALTTGPKGEPNTVMPEKFTQEDIVHVPVVIEFLNSKSVQALFTVLEIVKARLEKDEQQAVSQAAQSSQEPEAKKPITGCECPICLARKVYGDNNGTKFETNRAVQDLQEAVAESNRLRRMNTVETNRRPLTELKRIPGASYTYKIGSNYLYMTYRASDPVTKQEIPIRLNTVVFNRHSTKRERYLKMCECLKELGLTLPPFNGFQ